VTGYVKIYLITYCFELKLLCKMKQSHIQQFYTMIVLELKIVATKL